MTIVPYPLFNETGKVKIYLYIFFELLLIYYFIWKIIGYYTALKQFKVKLDQQETSYKSAKPFVERIKVLIKFQFLMIFIINRIG